MRNVPGRRETNLTAFLKANKAEFEFIEKSTTHHATEAAEASGLSLSQIAKTIVFAGDDQRRGGGGVRGDHMISRHKLAEAAGVRRLEVASDVIAERATGFPTGGIPPVGHRRRLPVFVDRQVASLEHVWCGGGARTRLVRLRPDDILRLSGATVSDIAVAQE